MFSNRLQEARKAKNLTQQEMANRLGVTKSAYGFYEQGRSTPDVITAKQIALILDVSVDYLLGNSEELNRRHEIRRSNDAIRIPVLGSVRAGIPVNADQDIIDWEEISEKMARTGDYFGLVVRGDSMAPALYEGDVLIVRKQPHVENGETAIVCVNGDEHTVKRVRLNPDGSMILMANNVNYAPIIYTAQEVADLPVTIIGKVVEFRRKL